MRRAAAGVAVMVAAPLAVTTGPASAQAPPACSGTPMFVTADCVDPTYNQPVIDSETDVTVQVPVHLVSGHFAGTTKRFNIYLPRDIDFEGRFFQLVYPLDDENAADGVLPDFGPPQRVAFGAASGAYTVQTNGGGGYRVDAAAAKFARTVAAAYYRWSGPIYGYVYGGSGGSYQTIGAVENTSGVWDGAVPFIVGVPTSIPNNFFVRAFARFVLGAKAQQIADAVSPGGSGDPFAGLTATERAVLAEVTRMGVPLRAWQDYRYVLGLDAPDGLLGFGSAVRFAFDPTYNDDFWTKPGYVGTEQSPLGDLFRAARIPGDVNNDWNLALLTYHRHQVPTRPGFYAFDQFRDANGQPIYPQRAVQVGPVIAASVYGGANAQGYTHTGAVHGKVIVVDNLLDTDAFPWHADWYASQVRQQLGDVGFEDNFRLWYNDNADHIGPRAPHLIDYTGILQQALRDVSAWAEHGIAPPRSTRYTVADSQVSVPGNAAARRGIQPVVDLTVRGPGHDRVDIDAGQTVTFQARIQVPPNTGQVVATDWDFTGTGTFTPAPFGSPGSTVHVQATFTYATPGTYYAALRATAQRDGDTTTPFARVQNLGRIRIVVH